MRNLKNHSPEAIERALRMEGGSRKVSFSYDLLDVHDVRIGTLGGVERGSISHGEFRVIPRSAKFRIDRRESRDINFMSDRIQPYFAIHMPEGGTVEFPLGIFLPESPDTATNGSASTQDIGAYDKTIIVEQDRFIRRFFARKGERVIEVVRRILETAGITRIDMAESDAELIADTEYPTGEKKLLACNDLLRKINHTTLWVDEYGFMRAGPYVEPSGRAVTKKYATDRDSVTMPVFVRSMDIATRPNVFKRVAVNIGEEAELTSVFINDDALSPISTVSRGRQIVDYEEINDTMGQKALDELTRRIAIESTGAFEHFSFGTAPMPHGHGETLYLDFPEVFEAPAKFHEVSWEMPLVAGGEMKHVARRVARL